jgi:hypothetical protein
MTIEIQHINVACLKCGMELNVLPDIDTFIQSDGYVIILWDPTVIDHECGESMRQGNLCGHHAPKPHVGKGKLPREPIKREIVDVELPE